MKSGERRGSFGEYQPVSFEGRRFIDCRRLAASAKRELLRWPSRQMSISSAGADEPSLGMSLSVMRVMMDVVILMFVLARGAGLMPAFVISFVVVVSVACGV